MSILDSNNPTPETSTSTTESFDFRSGIPSEYAEEACLKDIPDYGTMVKNYVHAQKAIGGMVKIPGQDATPEELASFHSKMGVPENIEDYDKALDGETWSEGSEPLKEAFKKAGLTVNQVKILREGLGEVQAGLSTKNEANAQNILNNLRVEWGSDMDKNLGLAKQTVATFGGEELAKSLESSGAGNDPVLIKTFAAIGKALASEGLIDGSNHGAVTKDAALQQAETLMADKAYSNTSDPRHSQVTSEVTRLYQIAYPGNWEA